MAKPKLIHTIKRSGQSEAKGHFFASSCAEWHVDEDIDAVIAFMKKAGFDFNLFYVPQPISADYRISNYAPQVNGAVWLGYWGPKE